MVTTFPLINIGNLVIVKYNSIFGKEKTAIGCVSVMEFQNITDEGNSIQIEQVKEMSFLRHKRITVNSIIEIKRMKEI